MLIIRKEQMKAFENDALRRFEDEMVVHSKEFTPRLCKVIGDEQLRVALRQAMERADTYRIYESWAHSALYRADVSLRQRF